MPRTYERLASACPLLCLLACGDATAVETSASDGATSSTSTTSATGTSEAVTTEALTAEVVTTEALTTEALTTEALTTDSLMTGEPGSTSTGEPPETTSTATTEAGETDDPLPPGCEAAVDETGGGPVAWSRHFGWPLGSGMWARQLEVSPAGAIAMAGRYNGEPDFGGGPMPSEGRYDVYFTLLDPAGEHLASRQFKALEGGEIKDHALAVDGEGNVYFAGSYSGTLELGGAPLVAEFGVDGVNDVLWYTYDVFLAKFGPDGAHLWSQRFGDERTQEGLDLAITPTGRVVVVGTHQGTLELGGDPLVSPGEFASGFYAEFTPDGEHVWSRSYGANYDVRPFAVAVDGGGRISSWGLASAGVDFGGGPLPSNGYPTFVAQFDALGEHRWSRRFDDADYDVRAIAADAAGTVVLAGGVGGKNDAFLARFAAGDGALVWNQTFADSGFTRVDSLALDLAGNTIVVGSFQNTIDLGGDPLGQWGGQFLAAHDAAGALQWQRWLDAPGLSGTDAIAQGPAGELVLTGTLEDCVDFGAGPLQPIGFEDLLVLRFDP